MKEFLLGVNYWASNAGADMWRNWDESVVEKDLDVLSKNGIRYLRVFPNWRDFQPVEPMYDGGRHVKEYRMAGDDYPQNPYYLDECMLERFTVFCHIAEKKGLKLIVGLITGWMSGRLYIPMALADKNIFTDPASLFMMQLFVKGFVERMKEEPAIYAWDLGNECNCMEYELSREAAYSWSSMIVNAIRACDQTRPVVSGMHSLELEGVWNIQDQGALTDILTTHPYPFWIEHSHFEDLTSFRTLLQGTAQTQYYATVGKKPCFVEEIGSMGPMVVSEEKAADFLRVNLWSNWANGAEGVMWWCAHEQSNLTAPPYDWNMCERELGMMDAKRNPKPTLLMMKNFAQEMEKLNLALPYRSTDAVCILTSGQDHWGIAYMSYLLAKQSGLTMDFVHCEQELPDADLFFLPSVQKPAMSRRSYDKLKQKVYDGATLYLSVGNAILTEFEELTGFRVDLSRNAPKSVCVTWKGQELAFEKSYQLDIVPTRAEVLLAEEDGNPLFGVSSYGKGKVYFLNFRMEEILLTLEHGFDTTYYQFYRTTAEDVLKKRGIRRENPYIGMTIHEGESEVYAVFINYTDRIQNPEIVIDEFQYHSMEVLYGDDMEHMPPFGTLILKMHKSNCEL